MIRTSPHTCSILLSFVLLTLFPWHPVSPAAAAFAQEAPEIASYAIDVSLDVEIHRLEGQQTIRYRNTRSKPITDLVFHLYLNAFEHAGTIFMRESGGSHRGFSFEDEDNGWIEVTSLRLKNGASLKLEIREPEDATLARAALPEPVQPGEIIELEVQFQAQLPRVFARTGWAPDAAGDPFFMVGQWFPKLGVWTEEGWSAHPFHNNAEFFADFGTYDVSITLPGSYMIGATGMPVEMRKRGNLQTVTYHAENVIDFAWTASPNFLSASTRMELPGGSETELLYLYLPEHDWTVERVLESAENTVSHLSDWYGPYPYPRLTMVDVPDAGTGAGGMEYPTMIMLGAYYGNPDQNEPGWTNEMELVTVHEAAHQWWQSIVAFNEAEEPWLDEGFTDYATARVMIAEHGLNTEAAVSGRLKAGYLDGRRNTFLHDPDLPMAGAAWEYRSGDYVIAAYAKPTVSLLTLERVLGEDTMSRIMRTFFRRYRFAHPTTEDFREVAEEIAGVGVVEWFFDGLVYGDDIVNFRIKSADDYTVTVEREGDLEVPVTIEVIFANGRKQLLDWPVEETEHTFRFPTTSPVRFIRIDPEVSLLIELDWTDNYLEREVKVPPVQNEPAVPVSLEMNGLAPDVAVYAIEVSLDPDTHLLEGQETLRYVNTTQTPMPDIVLHLYLNAFKSHETIFMRESGAEHRGYSFSPDNNGWIEVTGVRLSDGTELSLDLLEDGTLAQVALNEPVQPGQAVDLELAFTAQLPQVFARTGWALDTQGDLFYMAGQWFPKPGVWTDEGWNAYPFHAHNEFFADFGAYSVSITLPKGWVTGATGRPGTVTDNEDGTQTVHYQAEDVIDFAWTASPNFQTASRQARVPGGGSDENGEVQIVYLYLPEHEWTVERMLDVAEIAVTRFSAWFGPYPYPRLTLVDVPDAGQGAGGMEYPTLVTVGSMDITGFGLTGSAFQQLRILELVAVHEIGHQWWQSMAAFNEVEEPWLDEGFTDYAAIRLMNELFGAGTSVIDLGGLEAGYLDLRRSEYAANPQVPMYGPAWEFSGYEYSVATYAKPALSLLTLEGVLGEAGMLDLMSSFFEQSRFTHPTTEDFRAAAEEIADSELDWFFDGLVFGSEQLNYRAAAVSEHSITVEREGNLAVPTEIEVVFAGGRVRRLDWNGQTGAGSTFRTFEFPEDPPVQEFRIDPDRTLLIDLIWSDNGLRREPDLLAWLAFFTRMVYRVQDWLIVLGGI